MLKSERVFAYNFGLNRIRGVSDEVENAYWRDVGTIDAYFEANMDLKNVVPSLNLYNWDWPIITANYPDPPAKLVFDDDTRRGVALQSVLSAAASSPAASSRTRCWGATSSSTRARASRRRCCSTTSTSAAARAFSRAIIDKNVRIPDGDHIGHDLARDSLRYTVSEGGVTVVQKARDTLLTRSPKLLTRRIAVAASRSRSCVHGHFYQPPRENPWTDQVPREPSAAPFHDWNARIHAECYRANAFARIHDGDGPHRGDRQQLRADVVQLRPDAGALAGPPRSGGRRRGCAPPTPRSGSGSGSGGAIAQAYAHPIVPLCDPARRAHAAASGACTTSSAASGAPPRGCGCPRPAVSPATLETLIDLGVRYTILAPEQIDGVRPRGDDGMDGGRSRQRSTPGAPTSGATATARGERSRSAVFDGPLSRAVAFGEAAEPRREPARRGPARRPSAPRRRGPAAGAVRVGRRAVGAPQEVRRSDAGVRDARRGGRGAGSR